MNRKRKREAALALLAATPLWRMNHAPPGVRLLWRLGVNCPPPHLVRFRWNALVCGTHFGLSWVAIFTLIQFCVARPPSFAATLLGAICAGVLFGLFMAGYYAYGRRKYHLPLWEDFDPPAPDHSATERRPP